MHAHKIMCTRSLSLPEEDFDMTVNESQPYFFLFFFHWDSHNNFYYCAAVMRYLCVPMPSAACLLLSKGEHCYASCALDGESGTNWPAQVLTHKNRKNRERIRLLGHCGTVCFFVADFA